ncbi:MAG: hypothetical protein ACRD0G_14780 [Acidimicrobiales bacterium]
MNRHLSRTGLAIAVAAALAAAGCGDDDDDTAATTTTEADAPTETETVDITAVNYAFQGVPASVSAGSRLTLTNDSDDEVHEIVAIRIRDDVDLSVEDLLALPEEESEEMLTPGPPGAVIVAGPGEEGTAVAELGDGTLSEPGRYALVCFIPTGADPDEYFDPANQTEEGPPDVEGGPPHFTQGMFAELTVE